MVKKEAFQGRHGEKDPLFGNLALTFSIPLLNSIRHVVKCWVKILFLTLMKLSLLFKGKRIVRI